MFIVKKTGAFVCGTTASIGFVMKMDDVMYTQMQRHLIHPFRIMINQPVTDHKEIMGLGQGATVFVSQFKPNATSRVSAKQLMIDDNDYSRPSDHLFSYINQRQSNTEAMEKQYEKQVIQDLKLEGYFSEEFQQKIIELDVDPELLQKRLSHMTAKYSKDEYSKILSMTPQEIHSYALVEAKTIKVKQSPNERHSDLVKIQKKKQKLANKRMNKKTKGDTKLEIQRIIDHPELMQSSEQALDLIEQQDYTVKQLSRKEIKNLDKLREDAMSDIEVEVAKPASQATAIQIVNPQQDVEIQFVQQRLEELEDARAFERVQPTQADVKLMRDMETKRKADLKKLVRPDQRDVMEHKRKQRNIIDGKRAVDEKNRIRETSDLDYVKKIEQGIPQYKR